MADRHYKYCEMLSATMSRCMLHDVSDRWIIINKNIVVITASWHKHQLHKARAELTKPPSTSCRRRSKARPNSMRQLSGTGSTCPVRSAQLSQRSTSTKWSTAGCTAPSSLTSGCCHAQSLHQRSSSYSMWQMSWRIRPTCPLASTSSTCLTSRGC